MPSPAGKPVAAATFDHIRPKPVNVRSIALEVKPQTQSAPFFQPVSAAAESYFRTRFSARGAKDSLKVTVEQADVTQGYENSTQKVTNFMGVGGFDVYNLIVQVRLEHMDEQGYIRHGRVVTARRHIKISEHASLAEREQRQLEGMEALFGELDKQVENVVLEDMKLRI